jgi:nucleoside-diphosphate-sugar epimerase
MKYAILGSEGQIGNHLKEYLRARGETVTDFDIEIAPMMDLRIDYAVDDFLRDADFVFFLAFDVGGSTYLKKYQKTFDFVDNNTRILTNTFRALKDMDKPFIFASSQMSNMAWSSYGALKAVGEHYCRALNSPVVKFWNVYGVETHPEKTHVITDFVKMAIKGEPITMKTNGLEERQFLYADDCSEALYTLANVYANLNPEKEYHVTSFDWVSVYDVAEIISQQCEGVTIIPGEARDTVQLDRRNEPDPYIVNSGTWNPTTPLKEGISKIIEHEKKRLPQ